AGRNVNIFKAHISENISRREYGLTQLNVHRTYLGLLAAPVSLKAWYDFPISRKLFEVKTFLSLLICIGLVLFGVWLFPRSRLMSFCIFAYFLVLSIESTIIPIAHVIAEYRLYWATAFFCLFLVAGISLFVRNPKMLLGVICGLMTIYGVMTYQRNMLRSDELAFWRDIAHKSPQLQVAHINLGHALATRGYYEEAMIYFTKIAESSPSPMSYNNYGTGLMMLDRDEEAQRVFETMISLLPQDYRAWYKLGLVHMKRGNYSDAVNCFEQVMTLPPFWDISNDYNAALEKRDEMKE
ncbi:MAG: tetratricopeptide repeat protein, partial [Candidatus Omnitrophica bacterium]|nr:tetratricopeptide repeat protein [Candidatus Omnitrophota bacterium]